LFLKLFSIPCFIAGDVVTTLARGEGAVQRKDDAGTVAGRRQEQKKVAKDVIKTS
jgi:hypothetical protein